MKVVNFFADQFAFLAFLAMALTAAVFAETAAVDPLLGEPYRVHAIKAGEFTANLVEYPFGSTPRVDAQNSAQDSISQGKTPRGVILYLHGYNDYFFQTNTAEKADSAGFAFFAIDLHNYGRSIREWNEHCNMHDIREFYPEIDSAVAMARRMTSDTLPFILMGHSQGGLIMSLYSNDRPDGKFSAVVLNSPFYEFNVGWFLKNIGVPVVSVLGKYFPDKSIEGSTNPNYNKSINKSELGEWDISPKAKDMNPKRQSFSWIRAIHQGQSKLHDGLDIKYPVLLMYSDCSVDDEEYVDGYNRCDGILNVDDIKRYGASLGKNVKMAEIPGALHDVFLSRESVRDNAYNTTFEFIDSVLK